MERFKRPDFDIGELDRQPSDEARARLQFDWWCDDANRASYLEHLDGRLEWIRSRAHFEDDPAPPRSQPGKQGHASVALLTHPDDVAGALSKAGTFSNAPYAELGGATFMLALDPGAGNDKGDWHKDQRELAAQVLGSFKEAQLGPAAAQATEQAAVLSLKASGFDVAEFAEQAALRYFGLLFGFGAADHVLLEDAARRGYRALQYLIVGRHFVSEAATIPAAQQALARLATRSAALMDEYFALQRTPRLTSRPGAIRSDSDWPAGVQPWSELCLGGAGRPILHQLPKLSKRLSGQDLCNLVGGLLVGTVGNVQASVCLMVQHLLQEHPGEFDRVKDSGPGLLAEVKRLLALQPPVPFLPRRTLVDVDLKRGQTLKAGTDCILALGPAKQAVCPWGGVKGQPEAIHSCLGREFIEPLLVAVLRRVLQLPDLEQRLDSLTGEPLKPERLWGMGFTRYGLRYRRDKARVQQPLIVVMPVKAPIAENAERLRRVIRSAAPRIEWLLKDSGMVHVAWFEFMEQDSQLALRTVYDGDFDTYIKHFALRAGEVFDQLFESIEGGPPMPVAEHPNEFVETIRRFNRAPLAGYFYSAYPLKPVSQIAVRPARAG